MNYFICYSNLFDAVLIHILDDSYYHYYWFNNRWNYTGVIYNSDLEVFTNLVMTKEDSIPFEVHHG